METESEDREHENEVIKGDCFTLLEPFQHGNVDVRRTPSRYEMHVHAFVRGCIQAKSVKLHKALHEKPFKLYVILLTLLEYRLFYIYANVLSGMVSLYLLQQYIYCCDTCIISYQTQVIITHWPYFIQLNIFSSQCIQLTKSYL